MTVMPSVKTGVGGTCTFRRARAALGLMEVAAGSEALTGDKAVTARGFF